MNRILGKGLMICLAITALAGTASANGFGHGRGHGGLVPMIVRQYLTPQQIQAALASSKGDMHSLHSAERTARQTLEDDLIAGNSGAIQTDIQALETAQNNLLQEKVTVGQALLANLSATQRTQVSQFVTAYRAMEQQNAENRKALFQKYGIGWNAATTSGSATSDNSVAE